MYDFYLTPQERFLSGVQLEADVLTLRPSLAIRSLAVLSILVGLGFATVGTIQLASEGSVVLNGFVIANPLGGLLLAILGFVSVGAGATVFRQRVVASPLALSIFTGVRHRSLAWGNVREIVVIDDKMRHRWWVGTGLPPRVGDGLGLAWRWHPRMSRVEIRDEVGAPIRVDFLGAQARSEGMSFGEPTITESKAELLRRYAATTPGQAQR